jgi:hypothetical protein
MKWKELGRKLSFPNEGMTQAFAWKYWEKLYIKKIGQDSQDSNGALPEYKSCITS